MPVPAWRRAGAFLAAELRHLTRVQKSDRPWEMPLAAAAASGLPLVIAAWYGQLPLGLPASLGGLVFLHLPATGLAHRMAWLMACAFGLLASYTLGTLSHLQPALAVPVLALGTVVATMVTRFYAVPPPGALFFIMAAAIGAYTPVSGLQAVLNIGLLGMGCVLAAGIAFVYSLHHRRIAAPKPAPVPSRDFDHVVTDAVLIGAFVGLSLVVAHLLQLPRPYWVPVSCLAVIQGASLRAVWVRQVHRIVGTALGLVVFWGLATLPLNAWAIALSVTALSLVVETLVVRHYGLAVVFITPLAILLAEAAQLAGVSPQSVMQARLLDTIVGSLAGLAGGACLHSTALRARLGGLLRRWVGRGTA